VIALYLLAAHMIGDYVVQTEAMAAGKLRDRRIRARHVTAYTACFVPALLASTASPAAAAGFLAALWAGHFVTDSRRWASGAAWPPKPILVDQSLHLLQLAVLGGLFGLRAR
jgi:hypothetical protein